MANRRSYTDLQLRQAITTASSWADVGEALGKGRSCNATWMQRRATELGISTAHFTPTDRPTTRSYTDLQLRQAVATASSWADVVESLGKRRNARSGPIQRAAERLGLDVSHIGHERCAKPVASTPTPFSNAPGSTSFGRCSGLSLAAHWFLTRGYTVSIPLEPAAYDLITESDDGLKRVQVKSTNKREASGRFTVRLTRRRYDPTATGNAAGRYRIEPYSPDEIDLFFVVDGDGRQYVIPLAVTNGFTSLTLAAKYAAFLVS